MNGSTNLVDLSEQTRKINLNLFTEDDNTSALLSFSPVALSKRSIGNDRFGPHESAAAADETISNAPSSNLFTPNSQSAFLPSFLAHEELTPNYSVISGNNVSHVSPLICPIVTVQTSVRESLIVVEKNSQIEKVELLGTVYAAVSTSSENGE